MTGPGGAWRQPPRAAAVESASRAVDVIVHGIPPDRSPSASTGGGGRRGGRWSSRTGPKVPRRRQPRAGPDGPSERWRGPHGTVTNGPVDTASAPSPWPPRTRRGRSARCPGRGGRPRPPVPVSSAPASSSAAYRLPRMPRPAAVRGRTPTGPGVPAPYARHPWQPGTGNWPPVGHGTRSYGRASAVRSVPSMHAGRVLPLRRPGPGTGTTGPCRERPEGAGKPYGRDRRPRSATARGF